METLKAKAIAIYDERDYERARLTFEQLLAVVDNDADAKEDCLFNMAVCLGSAGEVKKALEILSKLSPNNDIIYNKAFCHYKLTNYNEALKLVEQLIANYRKIHQADLSSEIAGVKEKILLDSCIIEALNLKFAILIKFDESSLAIHCLDEIPIKNLNQLDGVTLHNKALLDSDVASSMHKLVHLSTLDDDSCPAQTISNLIILYLQNGQNKLAQELMKANDIRIKVDLRQYFSICLDDSLQSDEQIYEALDKLLAQTLANNDDVEFSLTIASHQAKILWLNNHYELLESFLKKLKVNLKSKKQLDWLERNMAHVLYMQDTRFEESLQLYEKQLSMEESIANVNVVCNLCVAYVLTGRNGDAEMLIKRMEREEEEAELRRDGLSANENEVEEDGRLCQMNLIIGTLYCVKYNYEFGLVRMYKALDPLELHLNPTTWWLVKRCLLSMLDLHSKQVICPKDDLFEHSIGFLIQCEQWAQTTPADGALQGRRQQLRREWGWTLAYEARQARSLLLSALHD